MMDKVLTLSTGIFAGLGTTVTFVGVPSVLSSSDPLPVWNKLYDNGKIIAITSILAGTASGIKLYLDSNHVSYLICAGLMFASAPFTAFFIGPINNKLFKSKRDDPQILPLIHKWNRMQWFRTLFGVSAFVYKVLYIN